MPPKPKASQLPITYRDAEPGDFAFIKLSWLRSGRYKSEAAQHLAEIFKLESTRTVICCPEIDRDHICGWICYAEGVSPPTVHYVLVRPDYQKKGIATALAERAGVVDNLVHTFKGMACKWLFDSLDATKYIPARRWLRDGKSSKS